MSLQRVLKRTNIVLIVWSFLSLAQYLFSWVNYALETVWVFHTHTHSPVT